MDYNFSYGYTFIHSIYRRVVSVVKGVIFFTNNKYYETLVVGGGDAAGTEY